MRNRKNSKIIIESKSYIFQLFSKNSSYFKITFLFIGNNNIDFISFCLIQGNLISIFCHYRFNEF